MLGVFFIFPSFAFAQTKVTLNTVTVQLWPEYDQPSMLVIVDFKVAPMTPLPVDLTFRIPSNANLIAVAVQAEDGDLLNAAFESPKGDGGIQTFTVHVEQNVVYRFEYYQPLGFNGDRRTFSYVWGNDYAVKKFSVTVLEPLDTKSLSTEPNYVSVQQTDGLNIYEGEVLKLETGEEYILNLQYEKSTDTLVSQPQGIQPAAPVDENTPGRISLSSSYPYVIGILGVAMILGGIVYYWRTGHVIPRTLRRRRRSVNSIVEDDGAKTGTYCPQCGARAKSGDRFCRTCGTRLRRQ
jgi:hypothetical protein